MRKGIQHLWERYNYELILVECGSSTAVPCYSETHQINTRKPPPIDFTCDGNPIDTLVLSLFIGQMADEQSLKSIGQPFLNLEWLES